MRDQVETPFIYYDIDDDPMVAQYKPNEAPQKMEAKALTRHIRSSPRKIRKCLAGIRGERVGIALNILHFSKEKAATVIEKTLRSAVANLMIMNADENINPETLHIKESFVDGGPPMKRFRAAAMGRAARIRRPSSHITIVVSTEKN